MDWNRAVERNSVALRKIVAALFAMLAAAATSPGKLAYAHDESASAALSVPRHLLAAILLILRPAESAARRLIIIAARGLVLKAHASRPRPADMLAFRADGAARTPAFALLDPLKRFSWEDFDEIDGPQGSMHSGIGTEFTAADQLPPEGLVNAARLFTRLRALRDALGDIPRQARRLARWQARRDLLLKAGRPAQVTPLRPGLPPGWRKRSIHEVDNLLKECHRLTTDMLKEPETG